MTTTAIPSPSCEEVVPRWLEELQASDGASGTIRRFTRAGEGFLAYYADEEQRSLTFSRLSPIALVGYHNSVQRTQRRATSMVNEQLSVVRAFCAWLTQERYLEVNPAKRLQLGGRQDAASRKERDDTQANAFQCQTRTSRDSRRNSALVQVLLRIGMRLDEYSQLTLDTLDFGERSGRTTIRQGKKARMVPLNASARQALTEYVAPSLNCDPTAKSVACSCPHRSPDGPLAPLWRSQKKGILTASAMRHMIEVLVRDVVARELVPALTSAHALRHTFVRNYVAEHLGDSVGLARLLGHTSLDTTRSSRQPTIEHLSTRGEQLPQNASGE